MPLLNAPDDVHAKLAVLLQRVLPMLRYRIRQGQIPRHGPHHHLTQLVVLLRIRIHVLHPAQAGVGFVQVVKRPQGLDNVFLQLLDLERLREEVQIQQGTRVRFVRRGSYRLAVQPTHEELEGGVLRIRESVVLRVRRLVLFSVEDRSEEGRVVAQ